MDGVSLAKLIRGYTRTNSTTFTNEEILTFLNPRKDTLARKIMRADEDYFISPMRTNLIAGLREYPMPKSKLARIKRVEAKFDGTHWVTLHELDLSSYNRTTDEAVTLENFSNEQGHAFYDINRGSLWLYCGTIVNVEKGLKLWTNKYPKDISLSQLLDPNTDLATDPDSKNHGFPREFHELLARGVSIDYKQTREKPISLTEHELNYNNDIQEALEDIRNGNLDREVIPDSPPASDRGMDGFNY